MVQRGTARSDGPRRRCSSTGSHGVPSAAALAAMGQHQTATPPIVTNPIDHDKIVEFVLSADPRGRDLSAPEKKKKRREVTTESAGPV